MISISLPLCGLKQKSGVVLTLLRNPNKKTDKETTQRTELVRL